MQIQFLGATGTVTGSKFLVSARGSRVLVDCGLFQGYKQLRLRNWSAPPFRPRDLDAVVLTHAHIDHSGYLPLLVKSGFRGPVYCTPGTADLCRILLPDAGRLQEEEAEYANRKGWSKHKPALPLYTEADAHAALERLVMQPFDRPFAAANLRVSFRVAGHILGAAGVLIGDGRRSAFFSGDVGRPHDPVMKPPAPPPRADAFIVESTYGDRLHDPQDPLKVLGAIIRRAIRRKGVVMIPAFAVGRSQALLYGLWKLKQDGALPRNLPVYLNSPMATDATALFHRHRTTHRLTAAQCEGMCHVARITNTVEQSRHLNTQSGPMVIVAGSGMITGGRIVHHLKAFASSARNTILITGYQAGGTRGAALLNGADSIKIHGEYVAVRAEVASIMNLSAHADQAELLAWLRKAEGAPQQVYVTHGEAGAADALRQKIEEQLRWPCEVPEYGQAVEVGVEGAIALKSKAGIRVLARTGAKADAASAMAAGRRDPGRG
jgi:metallo-beta-lactamase family protein